MRESSRSYARKARQFLSPAAVLLISAFAAYAQFDAGAAIIAIDEKPLAGARKYEKGSSEGGGGTASRPASSQRKNVSSSNTRPARPTQRKPALSTTNTKYDGFVVGDKYTFLNFEIAQRVQPIHTIAAKNAGAAGLVQVEVLIDPNGNVLTARARTGNALLHPEAEKAALATKFNRPTFGGKPARAIGFVVYRFGKAEDED